MDAQSILDRIESAPLTGAEYRTARRLLDRVSNQWTVLLSREEACAVCQVTTWPAARRALNRLEAAGLIGVHTNNLAYVRFLERSETDHRRAETDRGEAEIPPPDLTEPIQNGSQARRNGANRAETDHRRAETDRTPKDQDQLQEGRIIPSYPLPDPEGGTGGNSPDAPKRIDPTEKVRSVALLTDPEVNLYPKLAIDAAERYTFQEIAAQVFRYLRDRAAKTARSPGCIPQRLALPDQFPAVVEVTDTETAVWSRHMTPDESAQVIRRKYIPDEYADIILG